jgi:hypothetical protein
MLCFRGVMELYLLWGLFMWPDTKFLCFFCGRRGRVGDCRWRGIVTILIYIRFRPAALRPRSSFLTLRLLCGHLSWLRYAPSTSLSSSFP